MASFEALTAGSLYSGGIDGFAYAALKLGIKTIWHVENNKDLHKYLKKNYPDGKIHRFDEYVGAKNLERVKIIFGGDPCQPSSTSGLRLGKEDNRCRWPQMFRIISELRPDWVINENVIGSISNMVLDEKIANMESIGYSCQAYIIPAVAVNAHHERSRVWLVANSNVQRRRIILPCDPSTVFKKDSQTYSLGAFGNAFLQFEQSVGEPALFPISYGISDHILRLGAAGNSIVHQIPLIILEAIKYIYDNENKL